MKQTFLSPLLLVILLYIPLATVNGNENQQLLEVDESQVKLNCGGNQNNETTNKVIKVQVEIESKKDVMSNPTSVMLESIVKLTRENEDLKHQLRYSERNRLNLAELLIKLQNSNDQLLNTEKTSIISQIQSGANVLKSFLNTSFQSSEYKIIEQIKQIDKSGVTCPNYKTDFDKMLSLQQDILGDIKEVTKLNEDIKKYQKEKLDKILEKLSNTSIEVPVNKTCDTGKLKTNLEHGYKKYYFSYEQAQMNWSAAGLFCKSYNMQLVSVMTIDEWNTLKPEVMKMYQIFGSAPWTSGSDVAKEGQWKWTTSGKDVVFLAGRYYDMAETNTNENCLYLYGTGWGDYPCSSPLPFICEITC